VTTEDRSAFVRLELAQREVGDALSRADLERLLSAEPEPGAALEAVVRVRPATIDAGLRSTIDGARAALLRHRKPGVGELLHRHDGHFVTARRYAESDVVTPPFP
jgi:hypothetical protein